MVNSLLSHLNKKIKKRSLMDFSSFKIILFNKEVHVIIKLNFYSSAFAHFKLTNQNRAGIYNFPLTKYIDEQDVLSYINDPFFFFIRQNLFVNRRRKKRKKSFNQVQLYKNTSNKKYVKFLLLFFSVAPLFHYLKYTIQKCISVNLPGKALYNIHFLGVQNYEPNPKAILNFAELMFRSKKYSTGRVLHTIIRILVRCKKKYG